MPKPSTTRAVALAAVVAALATTPAALADPTPAPSAQVVGPTSTAQVAPQGSLSPVDPNRREPWVGPLPDPRRAFAPTGVAGALYSLYAALLVLALLASAPLAPWVCPIPRPAAQQGRAARAAMAAAVCATSLVGFLFARGYGLPLRVVTPEYEMFLRVADVCAAGASCPLAGNAVGGSSAHLGPLYMMFLTACRLVTADASRVFDLFAAFHGASAGLTLLLGARLLGAPAGVAAGLLYATNPDLAFVHTHLSHAAASVMPAAGLAWALASLVTGGGARALAWAALCLACYAQTHAVVAALAPAALVVVVASRRALTWRAWAAAGAVFAASYLTWAGYTLGNLVDLTGGATGVATRALPIRFLELSRPWSVAFTVAGVAALLVGAARRDATPVDRRLALGAVALYASGIALFFAATDRFWFRYVVVFFPYAPRVWAAGVTAPSRVLPPRPALRAAVSIAAVALAAWWIAPAVRRQYELPRGQVLSLDTREGAAVARALEGRGFTRDDLRARAHGAAIDNLRAPLERLRGGRPASRRAPGEVLVVAGCRRAPPSFALWQQTVAPLGRPITLAAYRPQLTGLVAETWHRGQRVDSTPFRTDPDPGEVIFAGSQMQPYLPGFRPPATWDFFHAAWQRTNPRSDLVARVRGVLDATPEDRVIVVRRDVEEQVTVLVAGVARAPRETRGGSFVGAVTEAFVVRADERAAPRDVEVHVTLTGQQFPRVMVDVYEEPATACAEPGARGPTGR